jgi:hypothetical protein
MADDEKKKDEGTLPPGFQLKQDRFAEEQPAAPAARAAAAAPGEEKRGGEDSFLRQAGGALWRQVKGAAERSVAPFTEAYGGYEEARGHGKGVGESLLYGGALGANELMGDPLGTLTRATQAPGEYRERRAAGYGPLYSAAAPTLAPVVGVDLPEMERQAALGHPRGVLGEAAVPAAEAAASLALPSTRGKTFREFREPVMGANEPAPSGPAVPTLPKVRPATPRPAPIAGGAESDLEMARRGAPPRPVPSASAQLDEVAQRMFKKPYGDLTNEEQVVVARNTGGGGPGFIERRQLAQGGAGSRLPGVVAERRAAGMPLPTKGPEAGNPPFTIETDPKMGIRWAKTPGLPDVSIPPRLTDPADISKYVADKQALQREGLSTLPGTPKASPAPPAAAPAPSGTLPQTTSPVPRSVTGGLPAAPPPMTLPSARAPGTPAAPAPVPPATLDEILQQATGQKRLEPNVPIGEQLRGQRNVSEKPPPGRWYTDKGSIPGEPREFLDVPGGDLNKAKAAIIEHETPKGTKFEAVTSDGKSLGTFDHPQQARAAAEKAFPATSADPLKVEFPDPAIRRLARANGPELLRAAGDRPEVVQAVHDLTNVEVRQAAINAGIDVGTRHVGSRMALGPEQISRQDLIAQMLERGVKPEDIPNLARTEGVPYMRPMKMPPSRQRADLGLNDTAIHHHELAHAILGGLDGLNPGAIVSHRHPINIRMGASASVIYESETFNPARLLATGHVEPVLDMVAGGAAANELIDGIPRHTNPGLRGDMRMARRLFEALKFPERSWSELWDAAIDRAKEKLTPEIQAIIKDEATRREDNLPVEYHYSANRVEHIIDRVRSARAEAEHPGQFNLPFEGAGAREGSAGGQEALAGREGRSAEAGPPVPPQKLKPFRPPQNKYTFTVEGREGRPGPETVELEALNRKAAWKKLSQQGGYHSAEMTAEVKPEVGPPTELEGVPAKMSPEKVDDWFEEKGQFMRPDLQEFLAGRPLLRKNVVEAYNALRPSIEELKNVTRAGQGFSGWWQRFIDTFKVLGRENDVADLERIGPAHEDALKAIHSAVSGNKNVEQANVIAWGAYRDWLAAGRPTDLRAIDRIARDNKAISGISGNRIFLDTKKLYQLFNSPQFKEGAPFTGEAFVRSPVPGSSPGSQKIPSMVAGTAGTGNWMHVVFDTHMRHLYGLLDLTDAQYIAASIHIGEAGAELGLRPMEAQEQMWGTVLGLKSLMKEGMTPRQAAAAFGKGTLQQIGKDYAEVVRDSIQRDPRIRGAVQDLQNWGLDILSDKTLNELDRIVSQGQEQLQSRARPINRPLLERSARRIQQTLREKLRLKQARRGGGEE